jgi:hypothetical protein
LRLSNLGVIWDVFKDQWQDGFDRLKAYVEQTKKCNVPNKYRSSNGFNLGNWFADQKKAKRRNKLSEERIGQLNSLGMVWDALEEMWEQGIKHYEDYIRHNKTAAVPKAYVSSDKFALGSWIGTQQAAKRNGTLSAKREMQLNSLGMIWSKFDSQWEGAFEHLKAYIKEHNDRNVSRDYKSSDGYPLGRWVNNQRSRKRRGHLSTERIARLDTLEFIW